MICHRLSDKQARQAAGAIVAAAPVVALFALCMVDRDRSSMAIDFAGLMAILFSLVAIQIVQSRRLNAMERDTVNG